MIFAAGFVLGAFRVIVVIPRIGELAAVAVELPIILALSWLACRWLVRRYAVPASPAPRLLMGGTAFAALMVAEAALATFAFDRSLMDQWDSYRTLPGMLGLVGQIVFGALPLIGARRARRRQG